MGLMDDAMQTDAGYTADTDELAEAITYTRADASTSTVNAIIDRTPPARDPMVSAATRIFDVWIPYSSSVGLTSEPARGDKIAVKNDPSDATAAAIKSLRNIVEADSGGWLCEFA